MNLNFILVSAGFLYSLICYMSYSELKHLPWAPYAALVTGAMNQFLWLTAARTLTSPKDIQFYSLVWDVVYAAVFLAMPPLMFGLRFSKVESLGLIVTVMGLVIIKLGAGK